MFAEGARVGEIPLEIPSSELINTGRATISLPPYRRDRRRMFRRLDYGAVPGFAPICMDSNDPFTVECSFKKRLMRDCPKADPIALLNLSIFVKEFVTENFRPI